MDQPRPDTREFEQALAGLDFPAARDAIVAKARDKGGIDTGLIYVLEALPQDSYDSLDALLADIRRAGAP